jgi:excisionase family DNA binding protein
MAKGLEQVDAPKRIELMTKFEVASLLQLSTRTIYRKVQEGVLPAPVKIGDTSRWRKYELEQWIEYGCKPVRPQRGIGS